MSRQAPCHRGERGGAAGSRRPARDGHLDEQRRSPLARHLDHRQRKAFLMRPKSPPSPSPSSPVRLLAEFLLELLDERALRVVEFGAGRGRGSARGSCRAAGPRATASPGRAAHGPRPAGFRPGSRPRSRPPGRDRQRGAERRLRHRQVDERCGGRRRRARCPAAATTPICTKRSPAGLRARLHDPRREP